MTFFFFYETAKPAHGFTGKSARRGEAIAGLHRTVEAEAGGGWLL